MTLWKRAMGAKQWLKSLTADYGLEALLFFIAVGNAEVLHQYLIATGSEDSWQLTIAIYATEILVVWASLWKTVGLFISAVLFMVSMVSISSVFGDDWLGHSGFSLAIFCGSLGNYVRRGAWLELGTAYRFIRLKSWNLPAVVPAQIISIANMSMLDIMNKFNTSMTHANFLLSLHKAGKVITDKLIEETRC